MQYIVLFYSYIYKSHIWSWHFFIYIYIMQYIYRVVESSSRKLAWLGFEPATTEFHSEALTDWAIRPWAQLTFRANFVQLLQFHCLFSTTFHIGCLSSSVVIFILIEVFCRYSHEGIYYISKVLTLCMWLHRITE